jgi:hypothetical protein
MSVAQGRTHARAHTHAPPPQQQQQPRPPSASSVASSMGGLSCDDSVAPDAAPPQALGLARAGSVPSLALHGLDLNPLLSFRFATRRIAPHQTPIKVGDFVAPSGAADSRPAGVPTKFGDADSASTASSSTSSKLSSSESRGALDVWSRHNTDFPGHRAVPAPRAASQRLQQLQSSWRLGDDAQEKGAGDRWDTTSRAFFCGIPPPPSHVAPSVSSPSLILSAQGQPPPQAEHPKSERQMLCSHGHTLRHGTQRAT